ncbi:ribosomal protein L14-domain-containing protein [Thelephora terrestris]|uniref:Ribosomal protein L14-domain-containing protein n=1 Tax=Thelephora terrestris TaxID=56493 RepID=A0A9P6LA20_9AGAM|nr:ribosomal protein L14-domain-containing protein [Thelephora terrestris]
MSESNFKRFIEVGRVVLLRSGPHSGKIAVISEVIDHNRAIVDGPATGVPRQSYPFRHLTLTPFRLSKLPRGAGSGVVLKQLTSEGILEKWNKSAWATKRTAIEKRRSLNDFERFKTFVAKKGRRDVVRKSVKVAKKA